MNPPPSESMFDLTPPTLDGRHVRLEPLAHGHAEDLARVAFDAEIWRYTTMQIHAPADLETYIETALTWQREGTSIPFATVDRTSGRAIGSTRFGSIDAANRRVEIGWTWLGPEFQRTALNTEAKLLMLGHAFEKLDCICVEFNVHVDNARSRGAVLRIGAKEEGVLRRRKILPDGRVFDWACYSVLDEEWPGVRAGLEEKLGAHSSAS